MKLRKHQQAMLDIINGIVAGANIKNIVADVVPGGGKSLLPVIAAGNLIPAGLAVKIAWICPRMSLQDQGERVFLEPGFRRLLGHNLAIRSSTNQANPCRGFSGWISTYQALAVDKDKTALRDFERYPYILVLDEWHHLAEEGEWTKPIQELYERAAYRVLLTGTLSRGDKGKIAFIPYAQAGKDEFRPCFDACDDTAVIEYGRKEALSERAIIPLEFAFFDGMAEWQKESGKVTRAKLSTSRVDANQALFTALKTEYATELLTAGVAHWKNHTRTVNKNGSLMVVAANIETAKGYLDQLRRMGCQAEIATSEDTPEAIKQIKALRAGKLKIMVAVAMISEGLDVPSISHIIYLTNVRTIEWIEQTISRAVRIDPQAGPYETQKGYIFAPADLMFTELAKKIEQDQCDAVAIQKNGNGDGPTKGEGEGEGGGRPGIKPLSSRLIREQGEMFDYPQERPYLIDPTPSKTVSEQETDTLGQIESHIRRFAFNNRYSPKRLNAEIYEHFGKPRRSMTLRELRLCLDWVRLTYPIQYIRGTGRARAPIKASAYPCEWRAAQ